MQKNDSIPSRRYGIAFVMMVLGVINLVALVAYLNRRVPWPSLGMKEISVRILVYGAMVGVGLLVWTPDGSSGGSAKKRVVPLVERSAWGNTGPGRSSTGK